MELGAILDVYDMYGDKKFYDYALSYADTMTYEDGRIETYNPNELSLDRINTGKFYFRIYEQTKNEKYKKALDLLRKQFDSQPRTSEGGFWHKKVYPHQMWLDGIYMGSPFYAEYAFRNNRPQDYADIIKQFVVIARHTYDPATGLYRHAWEKTSSYDIGLDFGFFNNRISGTVDYYISHTKDLLYYKSVPASSVYPSVLANIGETKGQGLEVALNTLIVKSKDFS